MTTYNSSSAGPVWFSIDEHKPQSNQVCIVRGQDSRGRIVECQAMWTDSMGWLGERPSWVQAWRPKE